MAVFLAACAAANWLEPSAGIGNLFLAACAAANEINKHLEVMDNFLAACAAITNQWHGADLQ